MQIKHIAITGGIGSGKSYYCAKKQKEGYFTLDYDKINKIIFQSPEIRIQLLKKFKTTDKNELRELILNNEKKREELMKILHKKILDYAFDKKNYPSNLKENTVYHEIPLVFEQHLESRFDKIISIISDKTKRYERLKQRGLTLGEIQGFMEAQVDDDYRVKHSDEVVYN